MKRYLVILVLALLLLLTNIGIATAAPGLQGGPIIHYVGFGDSLYGIAARYGVSAEAIMQINGIMNPDMIYVGQPLRIPGSGGYVGPAGPPSGGCANYHIVRAGETLSGVAWQYGVPVEAMLAHNQLYSRDMVYAGQELCVFEGSGGYAPQPANYQDYAPRADSYYHVVGAGETVSGIAFHYGVDHVAIIRANNLGYNGIIWEGQRLVIPGYHPRPAPPKFPPPAAPPVAVPYYDDTFDKAPPPPPPSPPDDAGQLPTAPDYVAVPARAALPLASQPIEVVVNGGQSWVGEAYEGSPDPNEITTLVVSTEDKSENWVVRIRSGDYEVKGEMGLVPEFGIEQYRFAFKYIPPGSYDVWIDDPDTSSEKAQVNVEAGQRVHVEFHKGLAFSGPTFASPDGWYLADWDNPSKPGQRIGGWSNIVVNAPAPGLWIKIRSEGNGYEAKCFTGSKGPGSCDFAGLNAGIYYIWIDGTELTLKTYLDGQAYATFTFGRQAVPGDEDQIGPVNYP
jgi:LysM repeat protein